MTIVLILAYIIIVIAVILRLIASEGWKLTPSFEDSGHFQINVILIIITRFLASIYILQTVTLTGNYITILESFITIFTATYGTPAALDPILTAALPSSGA